MNNYCKHLKKKNNKPYCKLAKKEITLSQCQECVNKEYRVSVKGKMVKKSASNKKSPLKSGKCTIVSNKEAFYTKKSHKNTKIVQNSKKQAKIERERYSVFTSDDHCMICKTVHYLTWNEIFRGRNRTNSMKYGFCLRMCLSCHQQYQEDTSFNDYWHKKAQLYFEEHYGTREDFIRIFRRNYL